jgi:hypothetical protein
MLDYIVLQCRHYYLSMFLTISQPPDLIIEPATWHFNIKEGYFNIYLFNLLVIYGYYNKDSLITHWLNYRSKGLIKIKTILLLKPLYNLLSLILKDFTYSTTLNFKYLFLNKRLIIKKAFLLDLYTILN